MTPRFTPKLMVIGALLLSMTTSSNGNEVKTSLVYTYNIFTKDIAIVRHTIASVNVPSPMECFRHCAKVCGCVAFQLTGASCELLDTDKADAEGDLVTREGTFLYSMQGAGIEVRSWTIVSWNKVINWYLYVRPVPRETCRLQWEISVYALAWCPCSESNTHRKRD